MAFLFFLCYHGKTQNASLNLVTSDLLSGVRCNKSDRGMLPGVSTAVFINRLKLIKDNSTLWRVAKLTFRTLRK